MTDNEHQARFSLAGHTALVTGAVRGLGWEITRAMAQAGADVLLNGRNQETLQDRVQALVGDGLSAQAAPFDVSDGTAAGIWIEQFSQPIDILINNVGMRHRKPMAETPVDEFSQMLDVNLTAAYGLARKLAPGMGQGGAIINVTSIAGPFARANDIAYTAAKGGLAALTRALAVELGPNGVRCNGISPGYFATEANQTMVDNPAVNKFLQRRVPLQRWGAPSEIAGAAVFLASPAASYINGQILTVDGGMTASF
jgi:gluconate 5-dehydrogenase